MKHLSQKQVNFLLLLSTPSGEWVHAHDFVGEKSLAGVRYYMSYKNPARCSDVFYDLYGETTREIVQRKETKPVGYGSNYYSYRIKQGKRNFDLLQKELQEEYRRVLRIYKEYKVNI
jgi:hypothetical protein